MSTVALSSHTQTSSSSSIPSQNSNVASRATRRKGWKLTRRGRFLFRGLPLLTVAALIVLGAIAFLNPPQAHAEKNGAPTAVTQEVVVKGGETLWDIALQVETRADTRDVVQQIIEINDLQGSSIDAGQRLEIPLYSEK